MVLSFSSSNFQLLFLIEFICLLLGFWLEMGTVSSIFGEFQFISREVGFTGSFYKSLGECVTAYSGYM